LISIEGSCICGITFHSLVECSNGAHFEFFPLNFIQIEIFDPFSILGLEPGAAESEIKKKYRRLSIQYHPDKNPDPG